MEAVQPGTVVPDRAELLLVAHLDERVELPHEILYCSGDK